MNRYSPEMNFLGLTDLRGLSLTEVQVLPHYSKFLIRFDQFEETCCAYEKEHHVNVIRLSDGDGVCIDGEVCICKTDMISLVQVQVEDAPLLQSMQQQAFAALLEEYQDHVTSPANESLERIMWKLQQPESYFYRIEADGKMVGGIRVVDAGDGSRKRISPLFILPAHRGKGYAQMAILEAERIHGAHNWELGTILQEARNCYLYEKMGYRQTSQWTVINDKMTIVGYEKD